MPERKIKERGSFGRTVPTKKRPEPPHISAGIRREKRVSVPENKRDAKREGGVGMVAFSLFNALKGFFGFLNEKLDAGIPVFDEKKGNVKIASKGVADVTVADNRNNVTLNLSGKKTRCQVNDRPPIEV